jgi:anaerobic magnesium-protoporphyrin IX monomethyl ester cyclase
MVIMNLNEFDIDIGTIVEPESQNRKTLTVVLVALYRYQNFAIRILHSLMENINGVKVHTVFFKHVDTNTFDPPTEKEIELFAETISDLEPDLVGISMFSLHVPIVKELNQIIRNNSSAKIIWGGVHPTIDPEECIKEADMICVGEGEGAFIDLVVGMRDGKNIDDIKNLWIRNGDRITKNDSRQLIDDLDSIPFPAYGKDSFIFINKDNRDTLDLAVRDRILWIQGSRGCPYVCSYCINSYTRPLFKKNGKYSRMRSPENIIEEINEQLKIVTNSGLPKDWKNQVLFVDEVFAKNNEWLKEFDSLYPKEVGIPYLMETLPHKGLVNKTSLDLWKSSGVDTINFGIQTGSDHIRNNIFSRPTINKEIIRIANDIADRGINLRYDLIGDNPYETEDTLEETINLLYKLPQPVSGKFNLFRLQWFPGYPLTNKALEDGHIKEEDASIEKLIKRTSNDWAYVPTLEMNQNRKTKLSNVIWLIVWGHTNENIVRYSVFSNSIGSKLCLNYLNFKSLLFGKVIGVGGLQFRYFLVRWGISFFRFLSKGDIKGLIQKIIELLKRRKASTAHSGYHKLSPPLK